MRAIAIQRENINIKSMSFSTSSKIIIDAVFGPYAIVGWFSTLLLMLMSHIEIKDIASSIAVFGGTIAGIGTGFYAILKMRENYLEAKAKARQEQFKLEVMEKNEEDDNIIKMQNKK